MRSQRALIYQNYIFGNYESVLKGSKEIFGRSETVLVAIKRLLEESDRALGATEIGDFKRILMGHSEVLRDVGL